MIINEKYFKKYSPIPLNYDLSEIRNYIGVAEKIWVIPVIGIKLYDEIQKQVDENSLSDENSTLLTEGGLWQYLAFATCLESLAFIWANFSEVGITLGKSDNSESVTLKDITYIEQNLRRQVEVLKESLIMWLNSHSESFPLYVPYCNSPEAMYEPNPNAQILTPSRYFVDLL